MENTQRAIATICDEIKRMLIEKNMAYGDAAVNPVRIFSKLNSIEQLDVRIDDKINRIMNGSNYDGDDDELDLIGYLILKRVARRLRDGYQGDEKISHCPGSEQFIREFDNVSQESGRGHCNTPTKERVCSESGTGSTTLGTKDCKCGSAGAYRVPCPAHPGEGDSNPKNYEPDPGPVQLG